jgi:hypothetical protein|tara:strand:- start:190 stop:333 length:144 start_codon:yes stop_codon:yes gene_type:complete
MASSDLIIQIVQLFNQLEKIESQEELIKVLTEIYQINLVNKGEKDQK